MRTDLVVVAGDWHLNARWAVWTIGSAAAVGCDLILHLGDFGFWPAEEGRAYLDVVEAACAEHGVMIAVTLGNHDWPAVLEKDRTDRGDGLGAVVWVTEHVAALPRGHRFILTGAEGVDRSFVSLGGAPSVDRSLRVAGRDWWPEEQITDEDVDLVVAGGPADTMLTHDAPHPAVSEIEKVIAENPGGWPQDALDYAAEGRRRLTRAFDAVRPQVLFHGHYHLRATETVLGGNLGEPFECRVESLGLDGEDGNAVTLDVATTAVTPIETALDRLGG